MKNKLPDKKMKIFINSYLGAVPEQREGGFRWMAGRAGAGGLGGFRLVGFRLVGSICGGISSMS